MREGRVALAGDTQLIVTCSTLLKHMSEALAGQECSGGTSPEMLFETLSQLLD